MVDEKSISELLNKLPGRAIVAFATRCSLRVYPLTLLLPAISRDCVDRNIAWSVAISNGATVARSADDVARSEIAVARVTRTPDFDAPVDVILSAVLSALSAARSADSSGFDHSAALSALSAAEVAADSALSALSAAARSDLDHLLAMNLGVPGSLGSPVDPTEFGPLGKLWLEVEPEWYRNPPIAPDDDFFRPDEAAPISVYFDLAEFGDGEIVEALGKFSDLYHALSGDVLVIEETGTLDPSRVLQPEGA